MVEVEPSQALEAYQTVENQEAELKGSWPLEGGLVRVLTVFYKIFKVLKASVGHKIEKTVPNRFSTERISSYKDSILSVVLCSTTIASSLFILMHSE